LNNLSNNFSFGFGSGILFLQQLHLWLLRGLNRKLSGDSKLIFLMHVIVEIFRQILPHLTSYLLEALSSKTFHILVHLISLKHCFPKLFFKSQFSCNFSLSSEVFPVSYPHLKNTDEMKVGWYLWARKPCQEFWATGAKMWRFLSRRSFFLFVGKASSYKRIS